MLVYMLPLLCWTLPCSPLPKAHKALVRGKHAGTFRMTHYWLAQERKRGRREVALKLRSKTLRITAQFATALRLQGSGILRNGRLVQYSGRCPDKPTQTSCLVARPINAKRFPLGRGAAGVPLLPFRSLAVDPNVLPLGTRLYVPILERWFRWHGIEHDGCFLADDKGGRILRKRLDLFVGTKQLYRRFFKRLPTSVRVYRQHPRCAGPLRPLRLNRRRN